MVVSFDTMVLIWGVKRVAKEGQEHMIDRTVRFLDWLTAERHVVYLTTQALAEYLGGFTEPGERDAQLAELEKFMPIQPFDVRAASIAAELLANDAIIKGIQKEYGVTRQVVKADIAIVASSIAAGAETLYSNDGKVKKAAQGRIIVRTIPDLPKPAKPQELFRDDAGA